MKVTPTALLDDLERVGVVATDVWDLVNAKRTNRAAIPVLLAWLRNLDERALGYDKPKLWEGLVRALSVPAARGLAGEALVEEFRAVDDPTGLGPRWVVGNALAVVADDSIFASLVPLILDRRFGRAREMIVIAVGRSRRPEVVDLLISLLDDPDVDAHAVRALGNFRSGSARSALERKLDDPRSWVRVEARKALAKLSS